VTGRPIALCGLSPYTPVRLVPDLKSLNLSLCDAFTLSGPAILAGFTYHCFSYELR